MRLAKKFTPLIIAAALCLLIYTMIFSNDSDHPTQTNSLLPWPSLGEIVHSHDGVPIYSNGLIAYKSHGKHYADNGYYYGHKWQCVEFIKRYYHDAHEHKMPSVWGHAKDFFDNRITHSTLNPARAMLQFDNGKGDKPQINDLLVWNYPPYGHVAVISDVHSDSITVVQQNISNAPSEIIPLKLQSGQWHIGGDKAPAGWLRLTTDTSELARTNTSE